MDKVIAKVQAKKLGKGITVYTGRMDVYSDGVYVWCEYSKSMRLTYEDALEDAKQMCEDSDKVIY